MKILNLRVIEGPNVYHRKPIIMMKVDLQERVDTPTNEIPHFNQQLLQLLPGLFKHTCSKGYEGGFCERLETGTYLAHVTEHIALELSDLAGIGVAFGKTRYCGNETHYEIAVCYQEPEGMKACLFKAVELVTALIEGRSFDCDQALHEIRQVIDQNRLGPSAVALIQAAQEKGIPWRRLGDASLIQLGYGKNLRRVQTAVTGRTSLIAADLVQDKQLTKKFLEDNAIPVPFGKMVRDEKEVVAALENMQAPYVVKPVDGHHGQGVQLNLRCPAMVIRAYEVAKGFSSDVLVEEMCDGKDFRVLVIGGRMVAASERRPPFVIGDGQSSVGDLIEKLNEDPRRGEGHSGEMTRVEIDEILLGCLREQQVSLSFVLDEGQKIQLRQNANLSTGGSAHDVTDIVHPEVRFACERIARLVDLDICGIDLIHSDISAPVKKGMKVIEVNAGPGLRMHLSPTEGKARPVGHAIVDSLYPGQSSARIPIATVTGTNGKTTVVRMIRKIATQDQEKCVGMTTTDGIWIGENQVQAGDTTGPVSTQVVLSDPAVDMAILEVARGGILRAGLGYDWSDVGVVTNIRPDHIGQDGIEDLSDLVWIKSLVAERVRDGGTLILNADDPESVALKHHRGLKDRKLRIVVYSTDSHNPALLDHLLDGGEAYWCANGMLRSSVDSHVIPLSEIPCLMQGKAKFQVSNALAAIAASQALGIKFEDIQKGLKDFLPSLENRGRMNIYRVQEGYAILDYGHNPDAMIAMGEMLKEVSSAKKTAVFGLPGDRNDALLREGVLQASSYFDHFIFRDDSDLRGRQPAEVPELMYQTLRENNFDESKCRVILDEGQAIETALANLRKNEIVVIFYEKFESAMQKIRQFDPEPVHGLPVIESSEPAIDLNFQQVANDEYLPSQGFGQ